MILNHDKLNACQRTRPFNVKVGEWKVLLGQFSVMTLLGAGFCDDTANGWEGIKVKEIDKACDKARDKDGKSGKRPNILIVLADDLGWSDLGCYGGEIRTPNLDALAGNGLRFTQTYNSARCVPSRASLLTGLYPHQAGLGWFTGSPQVDTPGHKGRLTDHCVTIAEVLKTAGYATLASGKWHVADPGPVARGFDEFYGFVHGYAIDSWNPDMMTRLPEGRPLRQYPKGEYYATTAITDHALDFLDGAREQEKPWLLYLGYQAPHFPLQAPADIVASYVPVYEKGWDVLRAERLERMKALGIHPERMDLPPRSPIDHLGAAKRVGSATVDGMNPAWDDLPPERRTDLAHRMAAFAAMVECMDTQIGRIVESLRESGELDNTLILFLSDNGACAEWEPFGFDMDPAQFRNPVPGHGININTMREPNILHEGDALAAMGGPDSLFSYGSAWANLCNTPLWLYKHYAHEGGVRTPMIAHWPERIPDPGAWRDYLVHLMDFMPTVVELAGAEYPGRFNGHEILPMEGRSMLPAIAGTPDEPRTLIFEHERNAAIREGKWKLVGIDVLKGDGVRPAARWQLYDVENDPAEQFDLAGEYPEIAAQLLQKFMEEARRIMVLPAP
jgi:arylsulfatase A-like enzyme